MSQIYVFQDNKLIATCNHFFEHMLHDTAKKGCYFYNASSSAWYRKTSDVRVRPVKDKHVPPELKALCLLLGIKTG